MPEPEIKTGQQAASGATLPAREANARYQLREHQGGTNLERVQSDGVMDRTFEMATIYDGELKAAIERHYCHPPAERAKAGRVPDIEGMHDEPGQGLQFDAADPCRDYNRLRARILKATGLTEHSEGMIVAEVQRAFVERAELLTMLHRPSYLFVWLLTFGWAAVFAWVALGYWARVVHWLDWPWWTVRLGDASIPALATCALVLWIEYFVRFGSLIARLFRVIRKPKEHTP